MIHLPLFLLVLAAYLALALALAWPRPTARRRDPAFVTIHISGPTGPVDVVLHRRIWAALGTLDEEPIP